MKKIFKNNIKYIIVVIIIITLNFVHLPYYVDTPGGIININDRIKVNKKNVDINGSLNLLYVSQYEATIFNYLLSFIIKDWDLSKLEDSQISNESTTDIYNRNRLMLDSSIDNATYVAYKNSGKDISIKSRENYVLATTKSSSLKVGDKIISVNGNIIKNIDELKKYINSSNVGDKLNLKVIRDGKEKNISVNIFKEKGEKLIGIIAITDYEFDLNPKIDISFKPSESGASGGLMLALCIYNSLTNEDIIKGRNIAGTGTIDMNGKVGEIDGIKYKIMGAVKNNIDVILVPSDNYKEAIKVKKEKGYDIKIVKVDTFKDAIEYLKKN